MFKKRKEIENFDYEQNLYYKSDIEIEKMVKEKFKNAKVIDTTYSGTTGPTRLKLDSSSFHADIKIERLSGLFMVVYYKGGRVWCNRDLGTYKGKSRFSKIVE